MLDRLGKVRDVFFIYFIFLFSTGVRVNSFS